MEAQELYEQAKDQMQAAAGYLFEFAESQVRKRGAFLPFGLTVDQDSQLHPVAATTGEDVASSDEILPLLHAALRQSASEATVATAVCEWVKITPDGGKQVDAAKVLVEHANGLTVAFYLPMRKKLLGGWQTEPMQMTVTTPEVGVWASA